MTPRDRFAAAAFARAPQVVEVARTLIAIPSPNPPGDVRAAAEGAAALISALVPGVELTLHPTSPDVTNLVARVHGAGAGKRVVFNGHLDTYPVNEALPWTVPPLGGVVRDGRLYGRGAADMKGGIAASILALALLAEHRADWNGEAVLTLAGDEESMGVLGTRWLLDNIPHARGDAVIIGDAGSPSVLRFGEKGFWWVEIEATGRAAHGAHVHLGENALDRLSVALDALRALRRLPVAAPAAVTAAIAASQAISEPLCGAGEAEVLGSVTVNIGQISGGQAPNLVPAFARAAADIRLPVGVSGEALGAALAEALDSLPGIIWRATRTFEPNHTNPDQPLIATLHRVAEEVLDAPVAVNMRVGGSDARWFRMEGLPTAVYGPTPFNMGGADEYVLVEELAAVMRVHALTAFDLLR
ncbi:acetylornithine deacetylase/succinyl-diaminopimelate desuccinylase-like protein [Humitalea rosea]|uniref:Acetylornithine deacetylase/succinyl-diaminopimelate desuccinylase-like protein n=1 Tax=Humitalea rosea TaxID=990373 RepID=A0A2W7IC30_9PROT|nr:M20/M25/M40 family metallo-hydrolase [Humitalea rosea]PZW43658.1 acetylornithine deacetylase/succinyl-diaminopimelate desuccinylase-like protein [Humitalea rosea]